MNTHCELCKTEMLYWAGFRKKGFIVGEKFYCEKCAIKACEQAKEKDAKIEELKAQLDERCDACRDDFRKELAEKDAEIERMTTEIQEAIELAESEVASEKLAGNVVKENYWRGELTALRRVARARSVPDKKCKSEADMEIVRLHTEIARLWGQLDFLFVQGTPIMEDWISVPVVEWDQVFNEQAQKELAKQCGKIARLALETTKAQANSLDVLAASDYEEYGDDPV